MRINLSLKKAALLICVVYTLLTVTSSGYGLLTGQETDTHIHLLLRFLITAVGIGSVLLFNLFPRWSLAAINVFHYAVTMGTVFAIVWVSGFFIELHPDAYRDIFFNFTAVYLLVSAVFQITMRRKKIISDDNTL